MYEGQFCSGEGNENRLKMLDDCWRGVTGENGGHYLMQMYRPEIGCFAEAISHWNGTWTQNSIGLYTWHPVCDDKVLQGLNNTYNLWFDNQGDGKTESRHPCTYPEGTEKVITYTAPLGAITENISLKDMTVYFKVDEYMEVSELEDFWVDGTGAAVMMKGDLLLVTRDTEDIRKYLPKLENSVNWLHSLIDENNGLMKVGPGGTLIEREYGGTNLKNGSFSYGYPSSSMVYYITALDKVIELERLTGNEEKVSKYSHWRREAKEALKQLMTEEGYFLNYLDAFGVKHGVFGAEQYNYFESMANHDAIAYGIVSEEEAEKIYAKIASIPELRQSGFICCVYPYREDDEMLGYEIGKPHEHKPGDHWQGGAWESSETRMVMAYYRLNKFEDAARSINKALEMEQKDKTYGVMYEYGKSAPGHPSGCIDIFGINGAGLRGLFEYEYKADRLILRPHLFDDITEYQQLKPVRFGDKKIYLKVIKKGNNIQRVNINGKEYEEFNQRQIDLVYDKFADESEVIIHQS